MNFFKKTWAMILAFALIITGVVVLILGGTSVGEIDKVIDLIVGVLCLLLVF